MKIARADADGGNRFVQSGKLIGFHCCTRHVAGGGGRSACRWCAEVCVVGSFCMIRFLPLYIGQVVFSAFAKSDAMALSALSAFPAAMASSDIAMQRQAFAIFARVANAHGHQQSGIDNSLHRRQKFVMGGAMITAR